LGWYSCKVCFPDRRRFQLRDRGHRADDDLGGRALHNAFEEETPSGIASMIKRIAALLAMMAGLAVAAARRPLHRRGTAGRAGLPPCHLVLAIFVGYCVVWSVTPALHTP
jgi:hypothetical protein